MDRKQVKRWRQVGQWRRHVRRRARAIDPFIPFLERRGAEVNWNCAVLHRELRTLGFRAGVLQVQRAVQPRRAARRWATVATVRFETAPGQQAQIDFGQVRLWIGEQPVTAHCFVFTLGYSRRLWVQAYPHERLDVCLAAHEGAFRHFGGVPQECLYDNARTQVLGREAGRVLWHPVFEDFARYWSFTPRACQPYRAQTKGKTDGRRDHGALPIQRNRTRGGLIMRGGAGARRRRVRRVQASLDSWRPGRAQRSGMVQPRGAMQWRQRQRRAQRSAAVGMRTRTAAE